MIINNLLNDTYNVQLAKTKIILQIKKLISIWKKLTYTMIACLRTQIVVSLYSLEKRFINLL